MLRNTLCITKLTNILSTVTEEHSLHYETDTIALSTAARFKLGTCTPWRWNIHAETCQTNECLYCYYVYDTVHLVSCNKQIYHWNHKKFGASIYRFPHVTESLQKLTTIWPCAFKRFCKPFPRPKKFIEYQF